ncbi:M23 family metallopeptidase [Streptomyces sp. NPDC056254]|uniref:M23 family metallopeptidase n=1 Tax=Streptomyces sp. NPDC056254 TaxID=3345763 RepID=UPI0035DAC7FF
MPEKGKCRPKSSLISRGLIAAGTGGAALTLLLLGAASNAVALPATGIPAQVPSAAVQAARSSAQKAPSDIVEPNECMPENAQAQDITGRWHPCDAHNRHVYNPNPSQIRPDLTLNVNGANDCRTETPAARPDTTAQDDQAPQEEAAREAATPQLGWPKPDASQQITSDRISRSEHEAAGESAAGFVAPVNGGINTVYKATGSMWAGGTHSGVDFGATFGTSVKAVGAGTVVSAGWAGSYGNQIIIQHADGLFSQYGHMSQLSVSAGQPVTVGQEVGLVGSTGNSTGPHLHFEIRTTQDYGSDIDPLAYLRSKGVNV